MNKKEGHCPKTLSGKHSWKVTGFWVEWHFIPTLAKCEGCGIVDDISEAIISGKKMQAASRI